MRTTEEYRLVCDERDALAIQNSILWKMLEDNSPCDTHTQQKVYLQELKARIIPGLSANSLKARDAKVLRNAASRFVADQGTYGVKAPDEVAEVIRGYANELENKS